MLPFLKNKDQASGASIDSVQVGEDSGKHQACKEIIDAIHAKDAKSLQMALESFLEMHSSEPKAE